MPEQKRHASGKIPGRVLGVLGGMGPAASARFLGLLAEMAPAENDREHPEILMYSNPAIPDRSAAITGKGESPENAIKNSLLKLAGWGANVLAVPCNTAHFFIDSFAYELPVPLVHIVDATVKEAVERSPEGAWLLSTAGTAMSGIYQKHSEQFGYELFVPEERLRDLVYESIFLMKRNMRAESSRLIEEVVRKLWEEKRLPVVAACTELPIAYEMSRLPKEGMISSLEALAGGCLDMLYS